MTFPPDDTPNSVPINEAIQMAYHMERLIYWLNKEPLPDDSIGAIVTRDAQRCLDIFNIMYRCDTVLTQSRRSNK